MDPHLRFAAYFNSPIMFKGYIPEDHDAGLQARNGLLGREASFTRTFQGGNVHLGFTILRDYKDNATISG